MDRNTFYTWNVQEVQLLFGQITTVSKIKRPTLFHFCFQYLDTWCLVNKI